MSSSKNKEEADRLAVMTRVLASFDSETWRLLTEWISFGLTSGLIGSEQNRNSIPVTPEATDETFTSLKRVGKLDQGYLFFDGRLEGIKRERAAMRLLVISKYQRKPPKQSNCAGGALSPKSH